MSQSGCFQLQVTGKLMTNCLNLRTLSIYVTSHLEESGSRIRHFNNAIGACNPLPFTLAYSTFPRWHFAQCQRHIHELPCRNCLLLGITTFLRNLTDISILLVQNWVTWIPLNEKKAWKVNIWQKITELCPCPLKESIVCQQIIWGKEQRIIIGQ